MEATEQFREATIEYLRSIVIVPIEETVKKLKSGKYQYVSMMRSFPNPSDNSSVNLMMIPTQIWEDYLKITFAVFNGRINQRLLQSCIGEIVVKSVNAWPISDDQVSEFADKITQIAQLYYGRVQTAFIPLANILLDSDVLEIPLARSTLRCGDADSLFTQKLKNVNPLIRDEEFDFPEDIAYLEIPVYGDQESVAQQIRKELTNSLMVLRYISSWNSSIEGTQRVSYNPASYVVPYPDPFNQILHADDKSWGTVSQHSKKICRIGSQTLLNAINFYGLENINSHFHNSDNEISERVLIALEWYDSAIQAETNWKALYRFVICINTALPKSGSNSEGIKLRFKTLVQYGGDFIGEISTLPPPSKECVEFAEKLADRIKHLYDRKRNPIVHGQRDREKVTDAEVKDARILAHNAIRLLAKLSRDFNWKTDKEADKWFKNPVYLREEDES